MSWRRKALAVAIFAALTLSGCSTANTLKHSPSAAPAVSSSGRWLGPYPLSPGAGVAFLSCSSVRFCIAIGEANRANGGALSLFSYAYRSGVWEPGRAVSFPPGRIDLLCKKGGGCYVLEATGEVLEYRGGNWVQIRPASTPAPPKALEWMSCANLNFCAGATDPGTYFTFLHGRWSPGPVLPRPGPLSCPAAGHCAGISYGANAFVLFSGNRWLVMKGGAVPKSPWQLSCPTVGFCAVIAGFKTAYVFRDGSWSRGTHLLKAGEIAAVSCSSPRFCLAVGEVPVTGRDTPAGVAFVYNGRSWQKTGGTFQGALGELACPVDGFCVVAGAEGIYVYKAGTARAQDASLS